ncbi:hypothetical protein [Rhizobium sp. YS-1r]|uniref:hypothetical protein n=1 Tax=Rhizobium sp. YS-1r TaxID=1532558 RepID=UPI000ADDAB10|nr:hypothetical protein [Rhizobium sp. YS-1r]
MIFPHRHLGGEELTLEVFIRHVFGIEQLHACIVRMDFEYMAFFPAETIEDTVEL